MNAKKIILSTLLLLTFLFIGCTDDTEYTVPETYTFERNGMTTVDYSGRFC